MRNTRNPPSSKSSTDARRRMERRRADVREHVMEMTPEDVVIGKEYRVKCEQMKFDRKIVKVVGKSGEGNQSDPTHHHARDWMFEVEIPLTDKEKLEIQLKHPLSDEVLKGNMLPGHLCCCYLQTI